MKRNCAMSGALALTVLAGVVALWNSASAQSSSFSASISQGGMATRAESVSASASENGMAVAGPVTIRNGGVTIHGEAVPMAATRWTDNNGRSYQIFHNNGAIAVISE